MCSTRREWIRQVIAAGAMGAGEVLLAGSSAGESAARQLEIIIVGAGVAGLCAAYELEKHGHRVVLLEAEPWHLGGRVRTLQFGSGLYGEAGAMRIPASHHLTRRYIREFRLPLRLFVEYNPDAFYFVNGMRKRLRDVPHPDPRFAQQAGGRDSIWTEHFDEIVGGMGRLPAAFAARLRAQPRFGCEVVAFEQNTQRRRASAIYRRDGGHHRVEGDFLICTLPLPLLRRVAVDPPLSARKRHALAEFRYGAASKTLMVARQRFWESEDGIYGGASYTDLPGRMIYYPSDNARARDPTLSAGPGVLLASYALGDAARELDRLNEQEHSRQVLHGLRQVHPEALRPGMARGVISWSWERYHWSRGAFAQPGQPEDLRRAVAAPEGRIHFAGEHTSHHPTWIQGALESALRVVGEILEGRR